MTTTATTAAAPGRPADRGTDPTSDTDPSHGTEPSSPERTFRPRSAAGAATGTTVFGQLNVEWGRLCEAPSTRQAACRWGTLQPALAGCGDLATLLDRLDAAGPDESDDILLALLTLAQGGHQVAGRAVLQAMLPKLSRMTTRLWSGPADEDLPDLLVATLWERVMTYPTGRRPRKVAANLALDTLNVVTAPRRRGYARHEVAVPDEALGAEVADSRWTSVVVDAPTSAEEAVAVLLAARRDGILTPDEAELLARVYVSGDSAERIDAELGLTAAGRRQRCSRVTRRLAAALAAAA